MLHNTSKRVLKVHHLLKFPKLTSTMSKQHSVCSKFKLFFCSGDCNHIYFYYVLTKEPLEQSVYHNLLTQSSHQNHHQQTRRSHCVTTGCCDNNAMPSHTESHAKNLIFATASYMQSVIMSAKLTIWHCAIDQLSNKVIAITTSCHFQLTCVCLAMTTML